MSRFTSERARVLTIGEIEGMSRDDILELHRLSTLSVDLQVHQKRAFNECAQKHKLTCRV